MRELVRIKKDWPQKGVDFLDIAPLLAQPEHLKLVIKQMALFAKANNNDIDRVGGFDSRGFLFGPMLAQELNIPFFMLRKAGKLPPPVRSKEYGLEYGKDKIEVQVTAVQRDEYILLVDDVLATGGTMRAGADLVEELGCEVSCCMTLIEIPALKGRETIGINYNIKSLWEF